MPRKSPVTYLCALPVLLAGLVLDSCVTCYFALPYSVGQKVEYRHDPAPSETPSKGDRTLELYRIGEAYYVKQQVIFAPRTGYSFSRWHCIWGFDHTGYDTDERTWEREIYYCRVDEYQQSKKEWIAEKIPAIHSTPGQPALPALLTEEQAAKLSPVFVKKLKTGWLTLEPTFPDRFSWTHYAILPVTGAVLVGIDLPCTLAGSLIALPIEIIDQHLQQPPSLQTR